LLINCWRNWLQVSISSIFYVCLFCTTVLFAAFLNLQIDVVTFWWKNIGAKAVCEMLKKLTPGVNFIEILWAALTRQDPKSTKKTDDLTVLFVLSGSAHVKAAHKTLMKFTPVSISHEVTSNNVSEFVFQSLHKLLTGHLISVQCSVPNSITHSDFLLIIYPPFSDVIAHRDVQK